MLAIYSPSIFQFTPLREGRRHRHRIIHRRSLFQFTPLREGRRGLSAKTPETLYFNSRPSARGDAFQYIMRIIGEISIHAPPRGATLSRWRTPFPISFQFTPLREGRPDLVETQNVVDVFQFTPLREGRQRTQSRHTWRKIFQFTPLREGRLGCYSVNRRWRSSISIHAPPRGATGCACGVVGGITIFQFTPLREGRLQQELNSLAIHPFQFTPLREGRR